MPKSGGEVTDGRMLKWVIGAGVLGLNILAGIGTRIAFDMGDNVKDMSSKIGEMQIDIAEMKTTSDFSSKSFEALKSRVKGVEGQLRTVEIDLTNLTTRLNSLELYCRNWVEKLKNRP